MLPRGVVYGGKNSGKNAVSRPLINKMEERAENYGKNKTAYLPPN